MKSFSVQPGEHIIRVFRQSVLILTVPLLLSLFVIVVPWYYVFTYEFGHMQLVGIWTVIICIHFFRNVHLWRKQRYTITSKRLIKEQHLSIFKRVVVETPLDRILNVSFKTTGLTSVLFGYGDVEVQVVGLIEPMVLNAIRSPAHIKEYLWHAHETAVGTGQKDISHIQERIGYTKENQRVI